jgi:hypothetical protein
VSRLRVFAVSALAVALTGCDSPTEQPGSLNREVRDGNFAFVVKTVDLSQPKVGNRTAEGVFVVVHMTVKNIGDDFRTVYCQNQKIKDLAGRTYDDAINVGAEEDSIAIKPGKRVDVTCAFDVPVGTLTAVVEVHDRAYSTGAAVRILGVA